MPKNKPGSYTEAHGGGTAGKEMQPDRTCRLARLFNLCLTYSSLCVSTGGARAPSTGVAFRP